ncbi:potassium transporter KtrA [Leucobacter sp. G161]|nr:potassium transporter KtrA [Leucobacter sp. G161]
MIVFTLLVGVAYPLAITGVGQLTFPNQANGSLRVNGAGAPVGSALIGQQFLTAAGEPDPAFFQPRPSAAGDGYDGAASSGSNLGPENPELVGAIAERKRAVATLNGVPESRVPADAVTASSSGLDPHISEAYAAIQVDRVAEARGLDRAAVTQLVTDHTQGPDLGFLGESRVNVLELNLALEQMRG